VLVVIVWLKDIVLENVRSLHLDASLISSVSVSSQLQPIGQYQHTQLSPHTLHCCCVLSRWVSYGEPSSIPAFVPDCFTVSWVLSQWTVNMSVTVLRCTVETTKCSSNKISVCWQIMQATYLTTYWHALKQVFSPVSIIFTFAHVWTVSESHPANRELVSALYTKHSWPQTMRHVWDQSVLIICIIIMSCVDWHDCMLICCMWDLVITVTSLCAGRHSAAGAVHHAGWWRYGDKDC